MREREVGPVLSSPFQAVSLLGAHGGGELGLADWLTGLTRWLGYIDWVGSAGGGGGFV